MRLASGLLDHVPQKQIGVEQIDVAERRGLIENLVRG
jgi:hypothetical protein